MFTKTPLKRFYINEFITYLKSIAQICIDAGAATLNIDAVNNAVLAAAQQVEAAYAYQKDSPITLELETLDIRRDDALMGIKGVAEGFAKHFDAAHKAAANAILTCFNKYGTGIIDLNYNAESEVVDKIVHDFETDATLIAALNLLGCTTWVAELKSANTGFKTKFLERNTQYASQPQQSSTQLKPLAIAAYNNLIKNIDSRNTLDTTGKYTQLIQKINSLTEQYNETVARRAAAKDEKPIA